MSQQAGTPSTTSFWGFRPSAKKKGADDCLPSPDFSELRNSVLGKPLTDDAAEIISAALSVGQRIRSRGLYVEDALGRLKFIVQCAAGEKPQLVLARDEFLRLQLEVSQQTGFIGGRIARLSGGSPTVTVLAALLTSLALWTLIIIGVRVLLDGGAFRFLSVTIFQMTDQKNLFQNVFFMDQRALLVIISAAFLGGVVSIATRLSEFAQVRGLDPFAMFWTALLKPLIGVTLSVFILATLSGEDREPRLPRQRSTGTSPERSSNRNRPGRNGFCQNCLYPMGHWFPRRI